MLVSAIVEEQASRKPISVDPFISVISRKVFG